MRPRASGLERSLGRLALLLACVLATGTAAAASTPWANLGLTINGQVHSMAVVGQRLIIAGDFTQIIDANGPHTRNRLAALDLTALPSVTVSTTWIADADATVRNLALSPYGNTLYVGGDFTQITTGSGTYARDHLAALDPNAIFASQIVTAWDPGVNGRVDSLLLDSNTLYVGGLFTLVSGLSRQNIAAVNVATAQAIPWGSGTNNLVRALALSSDRSILYAGGDFTIAGGQPRSHIAALRTTSGAATAWDPGADAPVHSMRLLGTALYIGGQFTLVGATARNRLAALDTTVNTGTVMGWNPNANAVVNKVLLAPDEKMLYIGGDFTMIDGQPRTRLARWNLDQGTLTAWAPAGPDNAVNSLILDTSDRLFAGGAFTAVGGAPAYQSVVGFDMRAPAVAVDNAGGVFTAGLQVNLTCTDYSGTGCNQIHYTLDGTVPTVASTAYTGTLSINSNTTLRYFADDMEGGEGMVETQQYIVDGALPVTDASLAAGLYGSDTLAPVTLACDDQAGGSGCVKTYYTTDGSLVTTTSPVYTKPIALDTLLPAGETAGRITLRFFSEDAAGWQEVPQNRVYDIDLAAPVVTPSLPGDMYNNAIQLSLVCDDGNGSGCASNPIYYTTDGSPPSDGTILDGSGNPIPVSQPYTGPLFLDHGTILTVLSVDNAGNKGGVPIGVYTFTEAVGYKRSGVGAFDAWWILVLWVFAAWRRRGLLSGGSGACR